MIVTASNYNHMEYSIDIIERNNPNNGNVQKWDAIAKDRYVLTYKVKYKHELPTELLNILDNGGNMVVVSFIDDILQDLTLDMLIDENITQGYDAHNHYNFILGLIER